MKLVLCEGNDEVSVLSAQSDFDLRLGLAAAKGYVPWSSSAFNALAEFLSRI